MRHRVYTVGYGHMSAPRLHQIVAALDAVLIDIRFSARSRIPEWSKGRLEELFGGDYLHLQSLGNAEYKTGGMRITHYENGKASIEVVMETLGKPVVLMCACGSPSECHRTVVGNMLKADGFEVQELTSTLIKQALDNPASSPKRQMSLFGEDKL